jgi:hypothetical protein
LHICFAVSIEIKTRSNFFRTIPHKSMQKKS